jgi:hypothetical protein
MVEIDPLSVEQSKSKNVQQKKKKSFHTIGDKMFLVTTSLMIKSISSPIMW